MLKIPCILFRGGTSKGPFFLKSDLPTDTATRDKLLLRIMGSPDARQIDGIGGADSLTSKVAIVAPSKRKDADVDYLFCQVHIATPVVDTTINCGNMLSAVVPFAITKGLVKAQDPITTIRVYNENTGVTILSTVQTPNKVINYTGDTGIDGVPGTAAPIKLGFLNAVGAKTGKLLPTGNVVDEIDGIAVSCVDVSVPMVIVHAEALGKTGYETKDEFEADESFKKRLEALRRKAAKLMGLGDVAHLISPKISIVSPPRDGGTIHSCYFTPLHCHSAHAVSGAVCMAASCFIEGSVSNEIADINNSQSNDIEQNVIIEHVSGKIEVVVETDRSGPIINFPKVCCIRTARPLFVGDVLVPEV